MNARRRRSSVQIVSLFFSLLLSWCASTSAAGLFSQLIIFGDSLSDVGNVSQATAAIPLVPTTPGPYYYNGRFSNGPVYAESLAAGLELPAVTHNRAGGNNFAHGGAKTSGTGFPDSLVVRDIDDQVGDFLASRPVDPAALFVVWAGSNDLIGGQTNMSIPVNRLATDIGRLITAGARNFLVANLPLLGYAPRYNGNPSSQTTYNSRSAQFNAALASMLDGLELSYPTIELFRFDTATVFEQAIHDPGLYGLANVTAAAAPGLQPGASSYNTTLIAPNAHEYLFWDDLHPTAAAHAMLAQNMLQLFALPGDFNRDDVVDAADYVVWRKGIGTTYMELDYLVWQANFGTTAGGGSRAASFAAVPEPNSAFGWLIVGILLASGRRDR